MTTMDNGVPIPEAAQRLGVSEKTVRRRIKAGELRAYEIATVKGSAWRVVLPQDPADVSTHDGDGGQGRDNAAIAAVLLYLAAQIEALDKRLPREEGPRLGPPVPLRPREEIAIAPSTQVGTVAKTVDNDAAPGVWARVRAWWGGGG